MARKFYGHGLLLSIFALIYSSNVLAEAACKDRIDAAVICFAENKAQSESLLKSASPGGQAAYKSVRSFWEAAEYVNALPATNNYQIALRNKCYNEKMGDYFAEVARHCERAANNCLDKCGVQDVSFCMPLVTQDATSSSETDGRIVKLRTAMSSHRITAMNSETTEMALAPNGVATPCTGAAAVLKTGELNRILNGGEPSKAAAAPAKSPEMPTQVLTREELPPARPANLATKTAPPLELTPKQALDALPTLQQIDSMNKGKGSRTPSAASKPKDWAPSPTNCPEWAPYDANAGVCNTGD